MLYPLSIFGLGIVAMAIMQNDFNALSFADSVTQSNQRGAKKTVLYVQRRTYVHSEITQIRIIRRLTDYMMNLNLQLFGQSEQTNIPADNLRECPLMTLTVPQMMKVLNISKNVAYELTKEPDFPCFRLGKKILINRELLQDWLNRKCRKAA